MAVLLIFPDFSKPDIHYSSIVSPRYSLFIREFQATSTRRRLETQTIVNAYFCLRPHEDEHRLRSVFKFIHLRVRFRIYAFTVSVFIVFAWTEGLNA